MQPSFTRFALMHFYAYLSTVPISLALFSRPYYKGFILLTKFSRLNYLFQNHTCVYFACCFQTRARLSIILVRLLPMTTQAYGIHFLLFFQATEIQNTGRRYDDWLVGPETRYKRPLWFGYYNIVMCWILINVPLCINLKHRLL